MASGVEVCCHFRCVSSIGKHYSVGTSINQRANSNVSSSRRVYPFPFLTCIHPSRDLKNPNDLKVLQTCLVESESYIHFWFCIGSFPLYFALVIIETSFGSSLVCVAFPTLKQNLFKCNFFEIESSLDFPDSSRQGDHFSCSSYRFYLFCPCYDWKVGACWELFKYLVFFSWAFFNDRTSHSLFERLLGHPYWFCHSSILRTQTS